MESRVWIWWSTSLFHHRVPSCLLPRSAPQYLSLYLSLNSLYFYGFVLGVLQVVQTTEGHQNTQEEQLHWSLLKERSAWVPFTIQTPILHQMYTCMKIWLDSQSFAFSLSAIGSLNDSLMGMCALWLKRYCRWLVGLGKHLFWSPFASLIAMVYHRENLGYSFILRHLLKLREKRAFFTCIREQYFSGRMTFNCFLMKNVWYKLELVLLWLLFFLTIKEVQ